MLYFKDEEHDVDEKKEVLHLAGLTWHWTEVPLHKPRECVADEI